MADTLLTGLQIGESPRWHEGRLWLADWGGAGILAVDAAGKSEVMLATDAFPCCFDWLPDGRLLVVHGNGRRLLRQEADGSLTTVADLRETLDAPWNEIVVDPRGNAYLNSIGFEFPGGEFRPGIVALATPDGTVRQVADGIAFPNGMAVNPDGGTLVVAESYAGRLTAFDIAPDGDLVDRRVWAELPGAAPDGICFDAEGLIWYADVPNRRCALVAEGGAVHRTVELDDGCFSCAVGDGTLFVTTAEWGPAGPGAGTGRVMAVAL